MSAVVRRQDRPVLERGTDLPTLQRLVDRDSGSDALTVLVNEFSGDQSVPAHRHSVEEVLVITAGECTVTIEGVPTAARAGDAVIVSPGSEHAIDHRGDGACTVIAVLASADAFGGSR